MHIRIATVEDITEMHRIRMSVNENRLSDPALVQEHHYLTMFLERGRGWVAVSEDRIVGFVVVDLSRSNVWALFVDPEAEGRGIGRQLHEAMMEWVFSCPGIERVWLSTTPGTRAEGFYRAAHWRHAGEEPDGEVRYEMARAEWLSRPGA
jgi:GNAT superfamily N-acetyltransferase